MSFRYAHRPHRLNEVLKVIARTPFGRELLEKFLPDLTRKRVTIEPYPDPVILKLRGILPEGQPIGASFVHNGKTGTIYLDPDSPLGVLAPFLAHEISHALNPKVWNGVTNRNQKAKVDAEVQAFADQFRFTQELKERDPEFSEFMKAYLPTAKILHEKMCLEDIEELYSLAS